MPIRHAARALLAAAVLALPAAATAADGLVSGNDTEEILRIARTYGKATLETQSNGNPLITGRMDGLIYQIFFLNCADATDCEDINFYMGFMDTKPSLEVINEWNYNKRFSRAYLDTDNDAAVEMDLDLVVPVSVDYMEAVFDLWSLVVDQFPRHIGYR